jgi:hypothetical protein
MESATTGGATLRDVVAADAIDAESKKIKIENRFMTRSGSILCAMNRGGCQGKHKTETQNYEKSPVSAIAQFSLYFDRID